MVIRISKITILIFLLSLFHFINCVKKSISYKYLSPDKVFEEWHNYIKNEDLEMAFNFEFFPTVNIIYKFKLNKGKDWNDAGSLEKTWFIEDYKNLLKKKYKELAGSEKKLIFKLRKKIVIKSYNVNVETKIAYLEIVYGKDNLVVKLKYKDKGWFLYNPFGYQNYLIKRPGNSH